MVSAEYFRLSYTHAALPVLYGVHDAAFCRCARFKRAATQPMTAAAGPAEQTVLRFKTYAPKSAQRHRRLTAHQPFEKYHQGRLLLPSAQGSVIAIPPPAESNF